jgi:hypothetical protein
MSRMSFATNHPRSAHSVVTWRVEIPALPPPKWSRSDEAVGAEDDTANGGDLILRSELTTKSATHRVCRRPARCELPSGLLEAAVAKVDVRASDHTNHVVLLPPAAAAVYRGPERGNEQSGDAPSNTSLSHRTSIESDPLGAYRIPMPGVRARFAHLKQAANLSR